MGHRGRCSLPHSRARAAWGPQEGLWGSLSRVLRRSGGGGDVAFAWSVASCLPSCLNETAGAGVVGTTGWVGAGAPLLSEAASLNVGSRQPP